MGAQSIRAAAVQLQGVAGNVAATLERVEQLAEAACAAGARLLALPEFFTSPVALDERVHRAVLPPRNMALDLLRRLARRHGCCVGGSMLIADGGEIYNRYHFVQADGQVFLHDKDLPTMWENAFYRGGGDDGAFDTAIGGVGAAVCWELIRTQTVRRLRGRVGVAMTGTHWWTLPHNWSSLVGGGLAPLAQFNRYLSENAPAEFARRLGAPVLQASHCGALRSRFLLLPGLPLAPAYDTEFVGQTQIVDAQGHVLAQRQAQEGPGFVIADITIGAQAPRLPLEPGYWIPRLPAFLHAYWHQQNACGKAYYRQRGRRLGLAAAAAYLDPATAQSAAAPATGTHP